MKGLTVRELIMALVLNGNLDDRVSVEVKLNKDGGVCYASFDALHVTRILGPETLIECYEQPEDE